MGFLSGLKKVGKVALKVAPYAALAIPGIGPLASMGIQAGIGAANGAMNHGGVKGALLGGALGAVTSKLGGLGKGLSPSAGAVNSAVQGTAGNALKQGLGSKLLNVGTTMASNAGLGGTKTEIAKSVLSRIPQIMTKGGQPQAQISDPGMTAPSAPLGAMPSPSAPYDQQFGGNFGQDQNNPNLANSINQGKLDAQKYRRPPMIPMQRQYGY